MGHAADRSSGIVTWGDWGFNQPGGKMRSTMLLRGTAFLAASALLALMPAVLSAQQEDGMAGERSIGVGGELSATAGPTDHRGYFNYTDYDTNTLRLAQLRLFGQWRAQPRLSFIGELRTENGRDLSASALYARWQPLERANWFVQAGRIPPVIGGFARRAYSRDNPVIGQPLAYQYLTALRPDALPATPADLARMRSEGWRLTYPIGSAIASGGVPLVSVSQWDTGVETMWQHGPLELAGALTRGSPSDPVVQDTNDGLMTSGRAALQVPGGLVVGVSAARGQWIGNSALAETPAGLASPSTQTFVGMDAEYGRDRWLLRGEWMRVTFDLPFTGSVAGNAHLPASSAFGEVRYRWRPRWQIGARVDRLSFGALPLDPGVTWDASVRRVEATLGYRVNRQLELRGGWQQNWRDGGRVRSQGFPAASILYWF
jgi:hypothetical protein